VVLKCADIAQKGANAWTATILSLTAVELSSSIYVITFVSTKKVKMKLVKGSNNKDCMGAAFAMVTDTSLEEVQKFCGHDGSQGYHAQEMTDYALSKRYAAITHFGKECYSNNEEAWDINLRDYITCIGVIGLKRKNGKTHAVATDGKLVYDPKGCTYTLDYIFEHEKILVFWQVEKLCSCKMT